MNKLLIFIILLVFSCNLSNSDQNNPLNMSNKEKISKYQINEPQTNIQFSNEIQALKDTRSTIITNQNDNINSTINYPPYIQTILKIEKQVDGNIIINEMTKESGTETKKLLEIPNGNISRLKDAIQYGRSFRAKDVRENQTQKENNKDSHIHVDDFKEYIHLIMPSINNNADSSSSYYYTNYIINGDNLLRIISNL
ncbi:hypothetical protein LRB48_05670 [Borreliella burgdorferi]|uniref:hypothetical protein n=1 Tax=Borreliella burgdorferi TaxID=139 RepID=UPI001E489734|nr:hypothetical protein [Borreliella burgdorferi]MCD2383918.1 hypothetical protein [Borreliella burgdorferi]MCD2390062.1 hypothetical protein [Borreliella burgdorferi]MCD2396107.1 hypothetical protein [Borreliella burgdorferi]MCD2397303.1 hypothetical protein [Borreliella burgdorferi]